MLITPSGLDPVFFPTSPWSTSLEPISQHVLTNLYMHGFRFIQDFYILVLTKFHDSYFLYVYMHVWGILSIRAISNVFSIMTKTFWTHSCLIVGSDVMGSYHESKISSILYIWKFSSPWWSAKKIQLLSAGEEKNVLLNDQ